MRRVYFFLITLMLFVQSGVVYGLSDQNVDNSQESILATTVASFSSTIIINNDTIWYGDFIVNATDNVIVANCTLNIRGGGLVSYGNLKVQNATINVRRGVWAPADYEFYGHSNFTAKNAKLTSGLVYAMTFSDSSRAMIIDSFIDILVISFQDHSTGIIQDTAMGYNLYLVDHAEVDVYNTPKRLLTIETSGSAKLNAFSTPVEWFIVRDSSEVNLYNSETRWIDVYDHAKVNLHNVTTEFYLFVWPHDPVVHVYESAINDVFMAWSDYDDLRTMKGTVHLVNSQVNWMKQHYMLNGSVELDQTGPQGDFRQAIHLTNTTVKTNSPPRVVSIDNTEATIRNVKLGWVFLFDHSEASLRNVTMERLYAHDYSEANLRYTRVTDNLFLLPGKPELHIRDSTIYRLRMKATYAREARTLQGKTRIVNSYINYMYQYYIFKGKVTMDENGIKGKYTKAHHLVNTTVDTMLPSMIVAVGDTQAHIHNVHNIWSIYLYDNSKIWLHNSSLQWLLYTYGYGGMVWGYETDTSVYGWVVGNITINAQKQAKTTIEMQTALEWVKFNITNINSPGPVPNEKVSIGTYVNITITATENFTAQIRIHYNQKQIKHNHIDEATLKIHYWNSTSWVPLTNTGVNTRKNYVWANITQNSTYTAIGITKTMKEKREGKK